MLTDNWKWKKKQYFIAMLNEFKKQITKLLWASQSFHHPGSSAIGH